MLLYLGWIISTDTSVSNATRTLIFFFVQYKSDMHGCLDFTYQLPNLSEHVVCKSSTKCTLLLMSSPETFSLITTQVMFCSVFSCSKSNIPLAESDLVVKITAGEITFLFWDTVDRIMRVVKEVKHSNHQSYYIAWSHLLAILSHKNTPLNAGHKMHKEFPQSS